MKYASIVPLIGGETIAMQNVFGSRPEYILSYSLFSNNDQHIVKYYNDEVQYALIDKNDKVNLRKGKIDVVNTVCPCAGLSSLSPSAKSDAAANDWMSETAKFVLENIQPQVFWGENAPRLASKMGEPVVAKLRKIGKDNGYTFMIYKTKSILHGLSQVRDRTFYFFFRGNKVPLFKYYDRDHERIEDTIRKGATKSSDPMSQLTNKKTPSQDPFYRFVLEEIHQGISHMEFQRSIERSIGAMDYLENRGYNYNNVAAWFKEKGIDQKLITRCSTIQKKLDAGGNIMRKITEIPKDYIGAFVGHYPMSLSHPDEDRYLTIRECLEIMKLPKDFQLQGGLRNLNHICQNVPVTTAQDMATEIVSYLKDKSDLIDSSFAVIDNKTKTYMSDHRSESLDKFFA